ncbi:hypothetical protein BDM02DRAFT_3130566 [Thelephora ganbajun]|uniref:Uncharacterized protein n=1 Tax=Thelephora ganbajun TaxID=370292 RepID=A0ACB6Z8W2_THEGA|nr:hypothetical protein BDM02DRAFT_3130566 [Thelephora ganbajun]
MTLENNRTFISPCNQRITRLDSHPHQKFSKPTPDSYGFEYLTMLSLVDAVTSQVDNEFPRRQYMSGCSFDDIVWQQAIGSLMNQDHSRCGCDMVDDEKVLFDLVLAGLVDPQEFDKPHKWSSHSIRYSAVMADRLWSLYEAKQTPTSSRSTRKHNHFPEVNIKSLTSPKGEDDDGMLQETVSEQEVGIPQSSFPGSYPQKPTFVEG